MSGGRVEFGLGTGWYDGEHRAYGIPFPPLKERFDRFEEQLAIITGLWSTPVGQTFSYDGAYYSLTDSPALPKPVAAAEGPGDHRRRRRAPHPGPRRRATPTSSTRRSAPARTRPPRSSGCGPPAPRRAATRRRSTFSAAHVIVLRQGRGRARPPRRRDRPRPVRTALEPAWSGTPSEIVDKIGAYAEAGATTVYLQILDLADLDHLDLLASQVLPQV